MSRDASQTNSSAPPDAPGDVEQAVTAPRIAIESVQPVLDDGRFAVKAVVGEAVGVSAVIFADGHDVLAARLRWRRQTVREGEGAAEEPWQKVSMTLVRPLGNDLWSASFTPTQAGRHVFEIEAWWDLFGTYRDELYKKHHAGVPVSLELEEGRLLIARIMEQARDESRASVQDVYDRLQNSDSESNRVAILLDSETRRVMEAAEAHPHLVRSEVQYPVEVDRPKALFSSWYELFPRSETDDPNRHGTFRDVHRRLPMIRDMGFDVLYFPPIHPIGRTHRKGPNNSLDAGPDDFGSPYAIGSPEGGHEAIHPQLGTFEDFRELRDAAAANGMEIALDFAIQCSPDHPWLKEHPGWFSWRPDGSIRYAENPPKKYQDIVNVDFYTDDAVPSLWLALRDVVELWVEEGVHIFRVDNPHTKPFPFWEWLIADIRSRFPDVLFLAEAFTRPAIMSRLGKLGFNQSYTYFTWRQTKEELGGYLTELNRPPLCYSFRPNFFVNTPDINPVFLQSSGRPGFLIRAALATMGSGSWGMYSGFELCESEPVPGKEEYLNSEKYELRPRDYTAPGNIIYEIAQLNRIRRENPALQTHLGMELCLVHNERLLLFCKRTPDNRNVVFIAVNLDPFEAQEAHFELPLWRLGLPDDAALDAEDLMTGHRWTWYGKQQWTRLEPAMPFGIWRIDFPRQ